LGEGLTTPHRENVSSLRNIHRQRLGHIAEPQIPEPSAFEVELGIEKAKKSQITRY
jgi:hypothetical protein